MASKNQKFNSYKSEKFKNSILKKYLSGISSKELSKKHNIPEGTIKTWAYKYRRTGSLENDINHNRGKHKNPVTLEDYKERYEILKKYQAFLKAQREKK